MILAVVGSGGKTTLIKQLADDFRRQKKMVFITTTTHMFIEPDTLLTDDPSVIIEALQKKGLAMAGIPEGQKIRALSAETYAAVCRHADVVLVEADGSKHMPLKYPGRHEPVIPANTDRIIVVWGPHGIGNPAHQVCHRLELVEGCLGIDGNTIITMDHVRQLIQEGYLTPLRRQYPHTEISVFPPL